MLIRKLGPKRGEVAGGWRKLYSKELHNLYSSTNIVRLIKTRRMIWKRVGEMSTTFWSVNPKEKTPHRRHWCSWEDYVKIDPSKILSEFLDWFHLAQDRNHWRTLVNTIMKLRVPLTLGFILTSWVTVIFSRKSHIRSDKTIEKWK
jgi:hypothetical protein